MEETSGLDYVFSSMNRNLCGLQGQEQFGKSEGKKKDKNKTPPKNFALCGCESWSQNALRPEALFFVLLPLPGIDEQWNYKCYLWESKPGVLEAAEEQTLQDLTDASFSRVI